VPPAYFTIHREIALRRPAESGGHRRTAGGPPARV